MANQKEQKEIPQTRADRIEMVAKEMVALLADWDGGSNDITAVIAERVRQSEKTIKDYIYTLEHQKRITKQWVINHFMTEMCHEFRLGLRINFPLLKAEAVKAKKRKEDAAEWLIDNLIKGARNNKETNKHLVIVEGIMIHGARDRDIELTILTDNGIRAIYNYIRYELSDLPYIVELTTNTVSYSYSRKSIAGDFNREKFINDNQQEPLPSKEQAAL